MSILVLTLFIISCEGEDGPAGPAGLQGEQGPQGDQGQQGVPGTANVIYSGWIVSEFDNDIIATSSSFTIDAPEITDDIIQNGTVLVYGRSNPAPVTNDTDVYPLPIVFGASRQQSYYYRLEAAAELVITVAANEEGESVGSPIFQDYRYVIIPGGQAAGKSTQDLQRMSYEEVTELFNIK